ncbi:hypothetical protein AAZX31_12G208100 [Glycine max]|uniref:DUF4408 domain-containing protein n=1 Tax=Glycine max TaxID=3847 RepID=I1LUW5_SOYBN|nr:uncharacterized protein LOC100802926 [Glycine max]KAG4981404.1 hypothetical protein JHK85_035362 [Glycine max]KAG4987026.1 hypothetical protein JHK86_034717 [Glycine max]KAG5120224.1 hypothetical protein JHK82_034644 [Glycine max]KAG5141210.1 hypothetical protein JHK84_034978 [Glycine max]KAH1144370.1 hypothetical protein GYH30_034548 [Glycine max]|eukprot:XP_003539584.1 uncharacterized protein LOC100802926 [Glycine max]
MGYVSVKVVVISTGVLSMAMGLKLTLPLLSHFLLNQAPHLWTLLLTCFTPPYLYIFLNFIILTIVASSKLNNHHHSPPDTTLLPAIYDGPPASVQIPAPAAAVQSDYNAVSSDKYLYETKPTLSYDSVAGGNGSAGYVYDENTPVKAAVNNNDDDDDEAVGVGVLSPSLQRKDSSDFAFADENEKPLVSARFSHRKSVRASPEGGKVVALGVAKAKKQETLESTWRTIREGRAMPLTRHLKKAETWETTQQGTPLRDLNGGGGPVMKKSETFAGREKNASARLLRKEPSLSQDELNRRVEAFINKFNADMRLQRQESLRQYKEMMMNRGAH